MTTEQFDQLVIDAMEKVLRTLSFKGGMYARGGDRFSNFKRAAKKRNTIPEDCLLGFVTKHEIALEDFVDDLKAGNDTIPMIEWEEKLLDIVAYMLLLYGLTIDRKCRSQGTCVNKQQV